MWYNASTNPEVMGMPDEFFDEYVDNFNVNIAPYGVTFTFSRTSGKPVPAGQPQPSMELGQIRMSVQHAKVMTYVVRRIIVEVERSLGVSTPVPVQLLNELRIAPEDWAQFWAEESSGE